jgi:hypothetical protein
VVGFLPVAAVEPVVSVGSDDPTVVRSVAVTVDDVVTAIEARHRTGRRTWLRITPPFSARMRARLHAGDDPGDGGAAAGPAPVLVRPDRFVSDRPPYPDPDETADALREAGAYDPETHRERHADRVAEWREAVRAAVAGEVALPTPEGDHRVTVVRLG